MRVQLRECQQTSGRERLPTVGLVRPAMSTFFRRAAPPKATKETPFLWPALVVGTDRCTGKVPLGCRYSRGSTLPALIVSPQSLPQDDAIAAATQERASVQTTDSGTRWPDQNLSHRIRNSLLAHVRETTSQQHLSQNTDGLSLFLLLFDCSTTLSRVQPGPKSSRTGHPFQPPLGSHR